MMELSREPWVTGLNIGPSPLPIKNISYIPTAICASHRKQFNERVDHMAKGLLAIGVKRGTHVGIWAGNVPDWLTFLYACAKIDAVA